MIAWNIADFFIGYYALSELANEGHQAYFGVTTYFNHTYVRDEGWGGDVLFKINYAYDAVESLKKECWRWRTR